VDDPALGVTWLADADLAATDKFIAPNETRAALDGALAVHAPAGTPA
jgi:hypothetical protein